MSPQTMSPQAMSSSRPFAPIIGGMRHHWPTFALRFWHGMSTPALVAMAQRHRWRQARPLLFASIAGLSLLNYLNSRVQAALYGRAIKGQRVKQPLFILGAWRSGTTLLHEYLSCDPRFRAPSTLECACPDHFLLSEWFIKRFLRCPEKRPMDNMEAGWTHPQEDEFALLNMGLPSMYEHLAFTEDAPPFLDTLNFRGMNSRQIADWSEGLEYFLKTLLVRSPGQLLLKSPTHTGRVAVLRQRFPDAKFIHISRDPRRFVPSTLHLWRSLGEDLTLQRARHRDEDFVFDCLDRMYAGYAEGIERVPADQLVEISYESLVAAPMETLEQAYRQLSLERFEDTAPRFEREASKRAAFRTNSFEVDPRLLGAIEERCAGYMERFGYC